MTRNDFFRLLAQRLYPVLRAEGFKGSGQTLRRLEGPLIHVFNVQGARGGDQCYLNLGAHLDFIPPEGGLPVAANAMTESHCIFRDRIEPPTGPAFGWAYSANVAEAEETLAFILSEWTRVGRAFFAQHAHYPQSYEALLQREIDPATIHGRTALHLARIALHLGQRERAQALVQIGLARAPERATTLKAELAQVGATSGREN